MKYSVPLTGPVRPEDLEPLRKRLPHQSKSMRKAKEEAATRLDQMRANPQRDESNIRKSLRAKISALEAVIELTDMVYQNTGVDGNVQLRCEILDIVVWASTVVCNADLDQYVPFCRRYRIATGRAGLFCQAKTVDDYHKNLVISGVAAITYIGILALPIYAPLGIPHTFAWIAKEYRDLHVEFRGGASSPQTQGVYFRKLRKVRDDLREIDMPSSSGEIEMNPVLTGVVHEVYEYSSPQYSPDLNPSPLPSPKLPRYSEATNSPRSSPRFTISVPGDRPLLQESPVMESPRMTESPRNYRGSMMVASPRAERLRAKEAQLLDAKRRSLAVI